MDTIEIEPSQRPTNLAKDTKGAEIMGHWGGVIVYH